MIASGFSRATVAKIYQGHIHFRQTSVTYENWVPTGDVRMGLLVTDKNHSLLPINLNIASNHNPI